MPAAVKTGTGGFHREGTAHFLICEIYLGNTQNRPPVSCVMCQAIYMNTAVPNMEGYLVLEVREMCGTAGLAVEKLEAQKGHRLHLVARKSKKVRTRSVQVAFIDAN